MDDAASRFCPCCGQVTDEPVCPVDGVETLDRGSFTLPAAPLSAGDVVGGGRYRVLGPLGAGAMGTVYAATQVAVERTVALKVLNQSLASDEAGVRRFYREAKSVSRLSHPNVVKVLDFGIDPERHLPFLAMERVEGESLGELLASGGPMAPDRALRLLEQVAGALAAAHHEGIVHRDLKPDNIMVSTLPDGQEHVIVLDFGIAKPVSVPDGDATITRNGMIVGTPRYMSPEQVRGRALDGRSDIYAVGCVLHELLTGRPPFEGELMVEVMMSHLRPSRPTLEGLAMSPGLVALHRRLLALDPAERPQDAAELATALRVVAGGGGSADYARAPTLSVLLSEPPPVEVSRRGSIAAGLALATVIGLGLWPVSAGLRASRDSGPRHEEGAPMRSGTEPAVAVVPPPVESPELPAELPGEPALDESEEIEAPELRPAQVASHPAGAVVRAEGRKLGATPLYIEVGKAGLEITVEKPGYEPMTVWVRPGSSRTLKLRPQLIDEF